jgi:quercetin dioxygenase-like cupin family protein
MFHGSCGGEDQVFQGFERRPIAAFNHDVDVQMIYVLKGWMKGEYDGQVVTMREGAAWLQPPKIKHTVLDYSDDCELLEIILPADSIPRLE